MRELSATKEAGVGWPELAKPVGPKVAWRKAGFLPVRAMDELDATAAMYCWKAGDAPAAEGVALKNCCCCGVVWITTEPVGKPKKREASVLTRPKLLPPMEE